MTEIPFFSIITASLNYGDRLVRTLESIRAQTFANFEHIAIDGGSIDGTLDILKRYEGLYPLYWISEPDRGIADALNKAVALASGRYLLVLHADDRLLDCRVLDQVQRLIGDERYDIYSFQVIRERPGLSPFLYRAIPLPGWHRFRNTIPHQGAFVHRRVFQKIGVFRTEFSIVMDYDFFYRAFQAGLTIKLVKRPVSIMGGDGVSSNPYYLKKRLIEEFNVQRMNERNRFWGAAQWVFQRLYLPYKTKCCRFHPL
jgi:glycosyltransferase involved in cell wall biosynthesis